MKKLFIFLVILLFSCITYAAVDDDLISRYLVDGDWTDELNNNDAVIELGPDCTSTFNTEDWKSGRIGNENFQMDALAGACDATDASSNRINTTFDSSGDAATFTLGCWATIVGDPTGYLPIMGNGIADLSYDYYIRTEADSTINLRRYDGGHLASYSTGTVATNGVYSFALRVDGLEMEFFVNGTAWMNNNGTSSTGEFALIGQTCSRECYRSNVDSIKWDECTIWNVSKSHEDILAWHNEGGSYTGNISGETTPPTITYKSKLPADYSIFNVIGDTNITYTISDASGINNDTVYLYYKSNTTVKDWYYTVGGVKNIGFNKTSYSTNTTTDFHFSLDDNEILPATYNYNEEYLETNTHNSYSLDSTNEYIKVRFFNVTNVTFGFLEFMLNNSDISGVQPLDIYYCNSTYSTENPLTSSDCTLYFSMDAQTDYNHSHHSNSYHQVIPFIVMDGKINDVHVTDTSYILFRGKTGVSSYNAYYVPVYIFNDSSQYTLDKGATWLNLSGTIDAHIHQIDIDNDDKFIFYACANDTLNNSGCSTLTTDSFEFDALPPNSALIYYPVNKTYNNTIIINYSYPSTQGHISYFNITLLNDDFTVNKIIISNNSNLTSYSWDTTTTADGNYYIRVESYNNYSLSSLGFSVLFVVDNTPPTQVWTKPLTDNTTTTVGNTTLMLSANFSDNNIVFAYNVTVYDESSNYFTSIVLTDIDTASVVFLQNITPDNVGDWTIVSTVYDAHTDSLIKEYENKQLTRGLAFDFTVDKYSNYKDNITIIDTSSALLLDISTKKEADRYLFNFKYDNTLVKDAYTWRKYEVKCDNIYLSENSKYNANFICFDDKKWIDFESEGIKETLIYSCGIDCFEVQLYMETTENVTFHSIGDLNEDTQYLTFEVTSGPSVPTNLLNLGYCAINTTAQAIMYIFLFAVLMVTWWFAKFVLRFPIITILTGLGFIGFAISLFYCSNIVGLMVGVMGIGVMGDAIIDNKSR